MTEDLYRLSLARWRLFQLARKLPHGHVARPMLFRWIKANREKCAQMTSNYVDAMVKSRYQHPLLDASREALD